MPLENSFIPVFIDAKPNEVLITNPPRKLCIAALIPDGPIEIGSLKSFKNTRRARKLESARMIAGELFSGRFKVDAFSVLGYTNGIVATLACNTINELRPVFDAQWTNVGTSPTHLQWHDMKLDLKTALGLVHYASMLPIIGLHCALRCRNQSVRSLKFCLDQLPNDSIVGSKFMKELSQHGSIGEMWSSNREIGFDYEIGVLGSYVDGGITRTGKEHPLSILVDWIAVGCLAKFAPEQISSESKMNAAEVDILATIWSAIDVHGSATLTDLDDPQTLEGVTKQQKLLNIS